MKAVNRIVASNSYLDMDAFTVPLREDSHWSTLDNLDLTTDATSQTSEPALFKQILAATSNRKPSSLFSLQLLL